MMSVTPGLAFQAPLVHTASVAPAVRAGTAAPTASAPVYLAKLTDGMPATVSQANPFVHVQNLTTIPPYNNGNGSADFYIRIDNEVMHVSQVTVVGSSTVDWYYTVTRGVNGTGVAGHAAGAAVYYLPGYQAVSQLPAPTGFTVTAVSSSQINLAWNGVVGPYNYPTHGYVIDQWNPSTQTWQDVKTVGGATLQTSITGLNANTTYYFKVRAYNDVGAGVFTNYQSAATFQSAVLAAPANFAAYAISSSTAQLRWSAVAGASSYWIYEYTTAGWQRIGTTGGTAVNVYSLTSRYTYYFDVLAVSASGTTGPSAPYKGVTMP